MALGFGRENEPTETELYVRLLLLTFKGGLWISRRILLQLVDNTPGCPTIDALLSTKKDLLTQERDQHKITTRQYELLFPSSGSGANVLDWDLSLLLKVIKVCDKTMDHLKEIDTAICQVIAHGPALAIAEVNYSKILKELVTCIDSLASRFDNKTRKYASHFEQNISKGPLDLHSSIDEISKLCRNDESMEHILKSLVMLDRWLKTVTTTACRQVYGTGPDATEDFKEDEDHCRVEVSILSDKVYLSGNKKNVKLAEEILLKALQPTSDKDEDPNTTAKRLDQTETEDNTEENLKTDWHAKTHASETSSYPMITLDTINCNQALNWHVTTMDRAIRSTAMHDVKEMLTQNEGKSCVDVFPSFSEYDKDQLDARFASLRKDNIQGEWSDYMGFQVYRRRYDLVSPEAAMLAYKTIHLTKQEQDRVKNAISTAKLHERHSNITVISASPFRSRANGKKTEKCLCIVVHCLLKGFIPFGEELFPNNLSGIPVDVREGYFQLGVKPSKLKDEDTPRASAPMMTDSENHSGIPSDSGNSQSLMHSTNGSNVTSGTNNVDGALTREMEAMDLSDPNVGPKSKEFQTRLRLGGCIGPKGWNRSGTLGGFVVLDNGRLAVLTCAHVVRASEDILQPAEAELHAKTSAARCLFGKVNDPKVFDPGAMDEAGVDAATIDITNTERVPEDAQFIWVRREQLMFAGFDDGSPPKFSRGKILRMEDIERNHRRTSVLKFGAESGLTVGLIALNGTYVSNMKEKMVLNETGETFEFFNQMEILSTKGPATNFFELGDSGSLLFMQPEGTDELHCIGLCIGCTSYHSCIVTPIESVFAKLKLTKFKDFTEGKPFL